MRRKILKGATVLLAVLGAVVLIALVFPKPEYSSEWRGFMGLLVGVIAGATWLAWTEDD